MSVDQKVDGSRRQLLLVTSAAGGVAAAAAAVPFVASHARECMINARSALDFGASTPAGENLGSLIKRGFSSPSHLMEYGGLDTMASNGSSSQ